MPSTANQGQYRRNYLQQAVCELRFPTLLALAEPKPPEKFANALRKAYPIYGQVSELTMNMGATQHALSHQFKTSSGQWTVSLKASALSLETTIYTGFEEFRTRLMAVMEAALPVIDTDFFTRVGLRYINLVTTEGNRMADWVSDQLVQPLSVNQQFGGVAEYSGRLLLAAPDGGLLLQHGLSIKHERPGAGPGLQAGMPNYAIDIDAFRSEVAAADVGLAVQRCHDQAFTLFDWTLGPAAKKHLADITADIRQA